jgi:[ribosomal protein S5]-alanine N-acetyltransferase
MLTSVCEPTAFNPLPGKRVLLRLFTLADISAEYIAWLNNPLIVRYSNQRFLKHTEASCRRYFESFANTPNLFLSIRMQADDLAVGTMTAYVSPYHGTADIGIMVGHSSVWGSGVGQDAWNTLCNWLLGAEVGLRKLTAGAARPNVAMVRIMERSGMQLEAVQRAQEIIAGEPVDLVYYSRFASHA